MSAAPLLIFEPDPATAAKVIQALGDEQVTLRDVAESFGANVEALALWMTRPEIIQRRTAIRAAAFDRARGLAANYLPTAIQSIVRILDRHYDSDYHVSAETARKCVALLLRVARLPDSPTPVPTPAPSTALSTDADRPATEVRSGTSVLPSSGVDTPPLGTVPLGTSALQAGVISPPPAIDPSPLPTADCPLPSSAPVLTYPVFTFPTTSASPTTLRSHGPSAAAGYSGGCSEAARGLAQPTEANADQALAPAGAKDSSLPTPISNSPPTYTNGHHPPNSPANEHWP